VRHPADGNSPPHGTNLHDFKRLRPTPTRSAHPPECAIPQENSTLEWNPVPFPRPPGETGIKLGTYT